ncbi:MAG TPA: biotin/lipoyl-binding protein [Verrucomicrobiota bacterium]|nr:biotin/lipoyl-binding protein [Verrucomicrobiota bacterium]HNU50447.1 biotin/lipoyl-binding protein [Verrucomicrobiota bacterium]
MADAPATFSESWYRVASQRLSLRPTVRVRRQFYRGERWFVLENPLTNQFFRLRPAAYEFVARLRPDRTVEEVWNECLNRFPDDAPGQESVVQLLGQLYHANLLQYTLASDTAQLFKRYEKTRQREIRGRLLNVMFMRFPLLDPDALLVRTRPYWGWLIGIVGAILWIGVIGAALKVVADHFPELRSQAQGILAPDNLVLLYAGLVIVKTLHEFGHAAFCRKFGGEVHTMGILLMIFTPVPYMDATSAWGFRERWKRVLVGAAGMIVELFVAGLATFVWAKTGQGTLHSLAYNMMFTASVSTLIFNLNPLLRFDGYYILSDLLGIPNLSQRAGQLYRYWAERYLYGLKKVESPAHTRSETFWLGFYGVTSGVYRVFVFGGILLLVADRFLLIGILMAAVCAVAWVAVPTGRLVGYLATSPKLDRQRPRAISVTVLLLGGLLALLQWLPFPHHFRAPGIVQSRQWTEVRTGTAGTVARLVATPGQRVETGQVLLELANPEIDHRLQAAQARRIEVESRLRQALQQAIPNLKPLQSLLDSATREIQQLETDRSRLQVQAAQAGLWLAPEIEHFVGRWLSKGTPLGLLIDPAGFEFRAIVGQEDGDRLFAAPLHEAEVRLYGQADLSLTVPAFRVIPAEQQDLPSAALGWRSGGPVAVAPQDPEGRQAAEPFFEVRATLDSHPQVALFHGRGGKIRFDLPDQPLLPRWGRSLRQLLQKRYQL